MADDWESESVATAAEVGGGVGAETLADMMAGTRYAAFGGWSAAHEAGERAAGVDAMAENGVGLEVEEEQLEQMRRAVELRAARTLELREYGKSWQELVRARSYAMLQRGRFPTGYTEEEELVPERVFRASRSYTVDEFETAGGLYTAILKGPVVANVVAKTGLGKSTKFAAKLAQKTGSRVLQITPDADLKAEHGEMLAQHVKVSRVWTAKKQPLVTMMSVAEFDGRFMVAGWEDIFAMFDVILMDEAHIPIRWFYAARAAMCSKGDSTTSLLLVTATNMDMSTAQSSLTRPVFLPKRMEEVVSASGWVYSDLAVDRAMYIVESDERLDSIAKLIDAQGCKVFTLSSGAPRSAVRDVRRAFVGDSPTLRILVAHERFGTGCSLPVTKVITTGLRMILELVGDTVSYKPVPLTKSEIIQHVGRADRGEVQSSGSGVVLLRESDPIPNTLLLESEKFGTAIILVAMGIAPGPMLAPILSEVFPLGLTRRVAISLLNVVGLPPEVTVRYLGVGGRLPVTFAKALDRFSLEHVGGLESREDEPKDYNEWFAEKPFGLLGYEEGPTVKVPLKAEGELKAIMHSVACIQAGIYVPEHVPVRLENPEHSGPENAEPRRRRLGAKGYRPPKVLDVSVDEGRRPEVPSKEAFRVDVPVDRQPAYARRGISVFNATFVEDLNRALNTVTVEETKDLKGRTVVVVKGASGDESPVMLHGPKEEIFFHLPKAMWNQLVAGDELSSTFVKSLLAILKSHCSSFAYSNAFANYGNPWLSVLITFSNPVHLAYAQGKAMHEELLAFFACLWDRYVGGMHAAVNASHETMGWWHRMVHQWGGQLKRPTQDGRVDIAQSSSFKTRLYDIRAGFSHLMVILEQNGVYSANATAQIQRILPVSRMVGYGVHDAVFQGKARVGGSAGAGSSWAARQQQVESNLRMRQNSSHTRTYSDQSEYSRWN